MGLDRARDLMTFALAASRSWGTKSGMRTPRARAHPRSLSTLCWVRRESCSKLINLKVAGNRACLMRRCEKPHGEAHFAGKADQIRRSIAHALGSVRVVSACGIHRAVVCAALSVCVHGARPRRVFLV